MARYFCMIDTKKSQAYTHMAIESFFKHTRLDGGDKMFVIDNDNCFQCNVDDVIVIKNNSPKSFSENINQVLHNAINDKADFVMLNNDIIFTPNWLEPLINPDTITLPLCNQYVIEKTDRFELRFLMDLEDYIGHEQDLNIIAKRVTDRNMQFSQPKMIPFYCFYLPYGVSSVVGLFDEMFDCGAEDIDYRIRAKEKGFDTKLISKSFVLHFMGRSTWKSGEDEEETLRRNKKYINHFISKWGEQMAIEYIKVTSDTFILK